MIDQLATFGRRCFAVAIIAFGVQTVLLDKLVTRAMPMWPAWIPAQAVFAILVGGIMVAGGSAILFDVRARDASLVLAAMFLASVVFIHLPPAISDVALGGHWTILGKGIALTGGVLAVTAPRGSRSRLIGRCGLAAFMILGGIQHFKWTQFVATLVPAWIPGHVFWTYFAGVALIAGGVGMLVPRTRRLAALASGAMLLMWVVMLHAPRALANLHDANETTAVFEALAFGGLAWFFAAD